MPRGGGVGGGPTADDMLPLPLPPAVVVVVLLPPLQLLQSSNVEAS